MIKDSLFDPESDTHSSDSVLYRRTKDSIWVRVFLYLDDHNLESIVATEYILPQSFVPRSRYITRTPSNTFCKLAIWTKNTFFVKAKITLKGEGQIVTTSYKLRFNEWLNHIPKDKWKREGQEEAELWNSKNR